MQLCKPIILSKMEALGQYYISWWTLSVHDSRSSYYDKLTMFEKHVPNFQYIKRFYFDIDKHYKYFCFPGGFTTIWKPVRSTDK